MSAPSDCNRCKSPVESGDLRCAICALPIELETGTQTQVQVAIFRCDGCGAALKYDVEHQAPRCAFCGESAHVEKSTDPIEQANFFLPFQVNHQEAESALKRWLGSQGFFRPADLSSSATVDSLKPIWWAAWVFDTDATISWTADSNAGNRRSTWAPHSGRQELSLKSTLVSASRGLTEEEVQKLTPHFDLQSATPEPHEMKDATVEQFDVQRSTARLQVAHGLTRAAQAYAKQWVPGGKKRKVQVAVLPRRFETRRLAFPSYVLAYRYRDDLYRTVIHGQRSDVIVGKVPLDWTKIVLLVVLVALLILLGLVLLTGFAVANR